MTISLGLICRRSIVLATDMQESFLDSSHKTNEADKMVEIQFGGIDGQYAVIVMSGGLECFSGFVEKLGAIAEHTPALGKRTIPDAVEQAIGEEKRHMRKRAVPAKTGKAWDKIFRDQGFDLLIAFFDNQGSSRLYRASFVEGIARPVPKEYGMTGSPQVLVDYLLDGISWHQLKTTDGMALAAYVVQAAKNHDQYCGGRTRMAVIHPKTPWILSQHEIAPFVRVANQLEDYRQEYLLNALTQKLPKDLYDIYDNDRE